MNHKIKQFLLFSATIIIGIFISIVLNNMNYFIHGDTGRIISVQKDSVKFLNWDQKGSTYTSMEDPQIVFLDIGAYVEKLELRGSFSENINSVQIFYTEGIAENFSENKSSSVPYEKNNDIIVIDIGRSLQNLRIDLTDNSGSVLNFEGATIYLSFQTDLFSISLGLFFAAILLVPVYFPPRKWKNLVFHYNNFKKYHFLLYTLVVKDFTKKYRRSVLGILWSVLNPLLMMIVISMVFQRLFRFQVENFPVYYLSGWLVYNFISDATSGAMVSVVEAGTLIRKVYIPKYIFPVERCIFSFINTIFSSLAVFIVILVLRVPLYGTILLFWIPLIFALFFSMGLGMLLSCLNVFFRDTNHLYGVVLTAWMYLTPIIYPIDILPAHVLAIVRLNPLYHYVLYFRQLVLYGTLPSARETVACILTSFAFFAVGLFIFKKNQDRFILFI